MVFQCKSIKFLIILVCASLIMLCGQLGAEENPYSLADLKALDEQGSYQELLSHLNDIRPAGRNDEWLALAERAAINTINAQLKSGDPVLATGTSEQILKAVPQLKKSANFMLARAEVGIKGFTQCFRAYYANECLQQLQSFVDQDPSNRQLAFQAGKLVRLNMTHSSALPFFVSAIKGAKDKEYCSDKDVDYAVEHGMNMVDERAGMAKELAFSLCYETLKPKMLALFYKSKRSQYEFKNLCPPLAEKKVLSDFQQAYCQDQDVP